MILIVSFLKINISSGKEVYKMKKAVLIVITVLFLFSFGCATKDYVKQQIDPLIDRISKLETRVSALEAKVAECCGKIGQAEKMAAEARALAQSSLHPVRPMTPWLK